MAVGLVEIGRFLIIREQVQTIADATVLAGAGAKDTAQKWVTIDVHTQHGSFRECGGDPVTCWCVDCGYNVVRNVVGLESDLLDNGGWRNYSLYSCGNCSTPYDTWYTFTDRNLVYNMNDMLSQVNALNNSAKGVRNNVTNIVDNMLGSLKSPTHRRYTGTYQSVMRNKTLEEKQELLDDETRFVRRYVVDIKGFSNSGNLCSSEYRAWKRSCYTDWLGLHCDEKLYRRYFECEAAVNHGKAAYDSLQQVRHIIDNAVYSVQNLEGQVRSYISDSENKVNSPDFRTGKEKTEELTLNFLVKATKTKGLQYGVAADRKDMFTPRIAVEGMEVFATESSPYYPSVVTILRVETPVIFQDFFAKLPSLALFNNEKKGISQTVCSQASTMYYDKRGHREYSSEKNKLYTSLNIAEVVQDERWTKYIKVPDDYCKEWRQGKHRSL